MIKKMNGRIVFVQDGNIDKALNNFKRKINDDALLKKLQKKQHYVKPTVLKKISKNQAILRWKKRLGSQELPKKLF